MRIAPEFELRLARLSRDLTQLQRSVQELLGAFDQPRGNGRRRNSAESVQYAVLEAALRTSEATLSQLHDEGEADGSDDARARPARTPSRSRALRT